MEDVAAVTALVRRCASGDAEAWEQLARQYNRRIYSICFRFTGSGLEAQDLAQEVFIKVYRTLASYDPAKGSFGTWITAICRNLLVDHFRKSRQQRVTDSLDTSADEETPALGERIPDRGPAPDTHLQRGEIQRTVQAALQKVSPDLREAVILRDLHEMDYKEIAQVLGVPEGTVKSRINRGRTELARLLSRSKNTR